MKQVQRLIVGVMLSLFILVPLLIWSLTRIPFIPLNIGDDESYEVQSGDNLYGLIDDLHERGYFNCRLCMRWYVRFAPHPDLVPGEYELTEGVSFSEFVDTLSQQGVMEYKITFVEGWNVKTALNKLWKQKGIERTLQSADPKQVFKQLGFLERYTTHQHVEGLFFPATYVFTKGTTDIEILKQAHNKLLSVLDEAWENRAPGLPYKDPYEALIMASIIEKETGVAGERDKVAGVFVRRLAKGMMLQTDPTVIYGMGDAYQGSITRTALRDKNAYNTYVINGLPPTPIALAGEESIKAALNPASGTSLYFVATGKGGHTFSDTLDEHNEAVARYRRVIQAKE
ncbi:MAG: endolytic transglycosylase MltG [Pseudomonadota bacterium]